MTARGRILRCCGFSKGSEHRLQQHTKKTSAGAFHRVAPLGIGVNRLMGQVGVAVALAHALLG